MIDRESIDYRCQAHEDKMTRMEDLLTREITKTNQSLQELILVVRDHESYIQDSKKWRMAVLGIAMTLLINVGGSLFMAGKVTEKLDKVSEIQQRVLEKNEKQDDKIEGIIRDTVNYKRNNTP